MAALVAHVAVLAGLGAAHGHVEVLVAVKGGGAPHGLVVVLHVRALVALGAEHRVAHHLAGLCGGEGGVAVRAGVLRPVDDPGFGGAVPELAQDGVSLVADQAGDLQLVEHLLVAVDDGLGDLHGHRLGGVHHLRQVAFHAGLEKLAHARRDLVRLLQLGVAGVDVALEGGQRPADGAEHRLGVERLLPVRVDLRVALPAPARVEPGHQLVQGLCLLCRRAAGKGQQQDCHDHGQQFHTLLLCQWCPVRGLLKGKDAAGKGNRRRRRGHAGTPWPVQGADAVWVCRFGGRGCAFPRRRWNKPTEWQGRGQPRCCRNSKKNAAAEGIRSGGGGLSRPPRRGGRPRPPAGGAARPTRASSGISTPRRG